MNLTSGRFVYLLLARLCPLPVHPWHMRASVGREEAGMVPNTYKSTTPYWLCPMWKRVSLETVSLGRRKSQRHGEESNGEGAI
ncbi:hypothetical protein F5Y18DRAFT_406324 [Xylariaceae sp. FL1019]|nr:hypothetical protein F5Y18DRAFT_406324 [Xylariaceae sp. FL1019]